MYIPYVLLVLDENCTSAYLEVYDALGNGTIIYPAAVGPVCGTDIPGKLYTYPFELHVYT